MSEFRIDLHVLSRLSNTPSKQISSADPRDMILAAKEAGLDALVFTEYQKFEGCESVVEIGRELDFPVLRGALYSCQEGRVLLYGVVDDDALDSSVHFKAMQLLDYMDLKGALVIPAHPFCSTPGLGVGDKLATFRGISGVEVLSGRPDVTPEQNTRAAQVAATLKAPGIGGSGAVDPSQVGSAYTIFPEPIRSMDELVAAIRAGKGRPAARGQ
ncbi:MAG: PHP domain-containing protein [bacterium]